MLRYIAMRASTPRQKFMILLGGSKFELWVATWSNRKRKLKQSCQIEGGHVSQASTLNHHFLLWIHRFKEHVLLSSCLHFQWFSLTCFLLRCALSNPIDFVPYSTPYF